MVCPVGRTGAHDKHVDRVRVLDRDEITDKCFEAVAGVLRVEEAPREEFPNKFTKLYGRIDIFLRRLRVI